MLSAFADGAKGGSHRTVLSIVPGRHIRSDDAGGKNSSVGSEKSFLTARTSAGDPADRCGRHAIIFLMVAIRSRLAMAVIASAAVAAGCGSSGAKAGAPAKTRSQPPPATAHTTPGPPGGSSGPTLPTPGPTGRPASADAVNVIRGWSDALRRGDVRDAARYFALPSQFINGPDATGGVPVLTIRSFGEAAAVNASLPCGARFLSADQRGRYVNALFQLTDRPGPGGDCGAGTGQRARTNFVITGGRIVAWIRAPDDPGDSRHEPAPAPAQPATPSAPPTPAEPSAPGTGPMI
jgi:hypothetical protein